MTVNPYQPPAPSQPPLGMPQGSLSFQGEVAYRDVERLGRDFLQRPLRVVALAVLLVVGAQAGVAIAEPLRGTPVGWLDLGAVFLGAVLKTVVAAALAYALLSVVLGGFVGGYFASNRRALSPSVVGYVEGLLDQHLLDLQQGERRLVMPLESICGARLTRHAIALTFMPQRDNLVVLPVTLFTAQGFQDACRLLEPIARQRPLRMGFARVIDARLVQGEPLRLIERPVERIDLAGTLTVSDIAPPDTSRRWLKQTLLAAALRLAIFAAIIFAIDYFTVGGLSRFSLFLLVPIAAVLLIRVGIIVRRTYDQLANPDRPLARVNGWLADSQLTLNTPIGCASYLPGAFQHKRVDDQSLRLYLPGRTGQQVALPRRLFATDDDFAAVVGWAKRIAAGQ